MSVGLLRLAALRLRGRVLSLGVSAALVGLLAAGLVDTGRRLSLQYPHPTDCHRDPSLCGPGDLVHAPLLRTRGREGAVLVVAHGPVEYRLVGVEGLDAFDGVGNPVGFVARWSPDRRLAVEHLSAYRNTAWKARASAVMAALWGAWAVWAWRRRG